jgi:hypothetical protein
VTGVQTEALLVPLRPKRFGRGDSLTLPWGVRTLFQYAWPEPRHDIGYKGGDVDRDVLRQLAWIAASAWGGDQALENVRKALAGGA